ncbi:MAG TPA: GAF domain-containing protein [Pseudonocardia sp.]|nr:GAF domain-containing protein [Pseudonocardia sp.]
MATQWSDGLVAEQDALRRVATLVATGAPPEAVFATVAEEVGRLLEVDTTILSRHESDGTQVSVGAWSNTDVAVPFPVGTRVRLGGRNVVSMVVRTGRPARIEDYADATGSVAHAARGWGLRCAVGVPIGVEGRLWGVISVASGRARSIRADTEARLAAFTELVATSIANAQARVELRRFAEEQAALRRVATLVARAAPPEEVFAAVTAEVGRVLVADIVVLCRYEADGVETVVGVWSSADDPPVAVGTRTRLDGRNVSTRVLRTGRPARIDDYSDATGPVGVFAHEVGIRASVGVPIRVDGGLWGVMIVATERTSPPEDSEVQLAGFTHLVGTAIANAQARTELRRSAEEQAALRRVATLVARAAPPEEVFAAVTAEVGQVLSVAFTVLSRYETDGAATVLGTWTSAGGAFPVSIGTRVELGGRDVHTLVSRTCRPARLEHYDQDVGAATATVLTAGVRASVGAPISVGGRLWGVVIVAPETDQLLSPDTETRLAGFTELIATALANVEAQAALTASRVRLVAAADAARRRIERDLHDGAQQRLASLALELGAVRAVVPREADELAAYVDGVATELTGLLADLSEIARGLHPAALAEGGVRPALKALARRSVVPVRLHLPTEGRYPDQVEIAVYYVVAEALTNVAKHAHANLVEVAVMAGDGSMVVSVRDDGRGGADITGGTGLVGLTDRVEALGGRLRVQIAPGTGTAVQAVIPLSPEPAVSG